jgi:hypothetical protein
LERRRFEADSNHRIEEGGVRRWKEPEEEERKGEAVTDRWDRLVSGSQRKTAARARSWAVGHGLGSAQEKDAGAGRVKSGPHALGREENRAESRERIRNPFPIFQIHFSIDFQIKFEFDLNHSTQNFKCNSMNAQSCFYPYI